LISVLLLFIFIKIFVAAKVLLIVLQEIKPDNGLEKAETYCLTDYTVGLCVYCHKMHIHNNSEGDSPED